MKKNIIILFLITQILNLYSQDNTNENINCFSLENDDSFKQLLADAENKLIISIGEATHGTSEFYKFRTKLSTLLIENQNFNTIVLEAGFSEVNFLNAYLAYDSIDLNKAIGSMRFWLYKNQTFKEFVAWVKNYNKSNNRNITFFGADIQFYSETAKLLNNYLHNNGIDVYSNILQEVEDNNNLVIEQPNYYLKKFKKILEYLEFYENISKNKKEYNINILRINQMIYGIISLKEYKKRDYYLSVMTKWYIDNNKTAKVIFWAHNGHINNYKNNNIKSCGSYLKGIYKEKTLSIGLIFKNGSFTAKNYEDRILKNFEVTKDERINYSFFDNCDQGYFKTDLPKFDKSFITHSIGGGHRQGLNSAYKENYSNLYDIVVFFRKTSATTVLK